MPLPAPNSPVFPMSPQPLENDSLRNDLFHDSSDVNRTVNRHTENRQLYLFLFNFLPYFYIEPLYNYFKILKLY